MLLKRNDVEISFVSVGHLGVIEAQKVYIPKRYSKRMNWGYLTRRDRRLFEYDERRTDGDLSTCVRINFSALRPWATFWT